VGVARPEERYFERRQVRDAIAWAEDGGIAVHRNFDHYHGTRSARGFVMTRPFLHVIGLRSVLTEWAATHGIPHQAIQPEKRRRVAHIDVFGDFAIQLLMRFDPIAAATASFERFTKVGSKLYAEFSARILEDVDLLRLAASSPVGQPPPNLLFGAVHYLLLQGLSHPLAGFYPSLNGGREVAQDSVHQNAYPAFRDFCLRHSDDIALILRERTVQTNEVGRSAALQPGFAVVARRAKKPLALVDLGAGAGLNLLADRFHYDYGDRQAGDPAALVRIECRVRGKLVPPLEIAPIASRVGLDRNPVDVRDPDQALWLRALVWPDQPWRAEVLLAAIRSAQADPPPLRRGNAADLLPEAIAEAPSDTALCIYSSFALYQFGPAQLARLHSLVEAAARERPVYRLAFEWRAGDQNYLELDAFDGLEPERLHLATAHEHGAWIEWLDANSASL
jgi:hypothetical protein